MISEEDMKILSGYERSFTTAIENGYARNLGSLTYKLLNEIYERITGTKYAGGTWGCPHCNLGFIKRLGQLYFEQKKSASPTEARTENVSNSVPAKKPGRPKKSATNNEKNTK